MKKLRKLLRSPKTTIVLFALAAVLIVTGTVGGVRAAPLIESPFYTAGVELRDIGISLYENGKMVDKRDYAQSADGSWVQMDTDTGALLTGLLPEGESFKIGKVYNEELTVQNTGRIAQFARVNVYKYWLDKEGNKVQDLSPDLIGLELVTGSNGWVIDENASQTKERIVLYYTNALQPGETSPAFTSTLKVDGKVAEKVTQTKETYTKEGKQYTKITNVYDYDGYSFHIEVEADAVQTHNAADAIWSAWGRRVSVNADNTVLTLQ